MDINLRITTGGYEFVVPRPSNMYLSGTACFRIASQLNFRSEQNEQNPHNVHFSVWNLKDKWFLDPRELGVWGVMVRKKAAVWHYCSLYGILKFLSQLASSITYKKKHLFIYQFMISFNSSLTHHIFELRFCIDLFII